MPILRWKRVNLKWKILNQIYKLYIHSGRDLLKNERKGTFSEIIYALPHLVVYHFVQIRDISQGSDSQHWTFNNLRSRSCT